VAVTNRVNGVVKFFNDDKGYGFITPEDGGKDIFVHRSGLVDGLEMLDTDQRVTFVVVVSDRKKGDGKMASDVQLS
jgi:CspA family cold shock protein